MDEQEKSIFWDSSSHSGCFIGETRMNDHARFKPGPSHWCWKAELIRRGGDRGGGKPMPVFEIDGMVRQLREQNKEEELEKRVSRDSRATRQSVIVKIEECELPSENDTLPVAQNPRIHGPPRGFCDFDFAQSESRSETATLRD